MKRLNKFSSFQIHSHDTVNIKGGMSNYCEWYILQRAGKAISPGQMAKAMELDQIVATDGEAAALTQGGAEFIAHWS